MKTILGRLAFFPVTLFLITVIVFTLMQIAPGDPASYYLGRSAHSIAPGAVAAFRHSRGLDRPVPLQYLYWLRRALSLDLGRSFADGEEVWSKIAQSVPNTLLLNTAALGLSAAVGVPFGVFLGSRRRSLARESAHAFLLLLFSLPTFWVALLLMRLLAMRWQLLPLYGMESDDAGNSSGAMLLVDRLRHLILPGICLSLTQIAIICRLTSNSVEEVLLDDHIRATRSRGIPESQVLIRHALRNSWLPLISFGGVLIPALLSGSVIIERMFQWNGVGGALFTAVLSRDYPTVMGITAVTAVGVLLIGLLVDVLYVLSDPRVRFEQS